MTLFQGVANRAIGQDAVFLCGTDHVTADAVLCSTMGRLILMTPQGGNLIRIHGSFVTDSDISRVVNHLKQQGAPVYDESIIAEPEKEEGASEFDDEVSDELYDHVSARQCPPTPTVSMTCISGVCKHHS